MMIHPRLENTGPFAALRLLVDIEGRPCREDEAVAVRYEVRDGRAQTVCHCPDQEMANAIADMLNAYAPGKR